MTTNHTPGPWKKARNSSFWEVVTPFQDQLIDEANEFSPSVAYAWGSTEEEAEANASLIAAAPDLLEACQAADWNSLDLPEFVREKLSAAISKATGA